MNETLWTQIREKCIIGGKNNSYSKPIIPYSPSVWFISHLNILKKPRKKENKITKENEIMNKETNFFAKLITTTNLPSLFKVTVSLVVDAAKELEVHPSLASLLQKDSRELSLCWWPLHYRSTWEIGARFQSNQAAISRCDL